MRRKPQLLITGLTLILLGGVFWWTQQSPPESERLEKPEDTLWRMISARQRGDIQGYLDCFTGNLRAQLDRLVREQGEANFRAYLQQLVAPIKGIVVTPSEIVGETARIKVERIFEDRHEIQVYHFARVKNRWKIIRLEPIQRVVPSIPYGTEAFRFQEEMPSKL